MRTHAIVEGEIAPDRDARLGHAGVGSQVDFLIFDRSPEPLDKDIVAPGALAVHADGDLGILQYLDEVRRGELAALVGVEDLRPAMTGQRLLQRFNAEVR